MQTLNEIVNTEIAYALAENYEKLKNLPKLDGRTIIGNIKELDPIVPGYVKDGKAVNEDNVGTIGVLDVKRIWDSVFNK